MTTPEASNVTVSVITPCYNGARYLEDTLGSAVSQSRPPTEVILVDDGSTDDSAAIAERFGPPVRVIRQPNRGESVARNRGIDEARGTHVLFLDADDLLAPDALLHLGGALEHEGDAVVAVMSCAWFTSDPNEPYLVKPAQHREFYPHIIEENIAPPHCWLAPVDVVRRAGGFCESMRWFEDWDLWWRVGLHASRIVPVEYTGALYRQHATSQLATTDPADRARGHAALVGRMAAELLQHPDIIERHGERLYWSLWSAVTHARNAGVEWDELASVKTGLAALARVGPASVTSSRSARAFRWMGVRAGFALQKGAR